MIKNYGLQIQKDVEIDLEEVSRKIRKKEGKDMCIIIDGQTLDSILSDKELSTNFLHIAIAAKSVICCRVSPKQKSKVVQLAKTHGKWVTLSIGDGANDVPMIMEAHIGVGIQGKEGTQAVRSADFSIGQFRFLEKLLLSYGRIGYVKVSRFICYYFYKNIILVFNDIFFAFSNGFSGQIYFADYLSTLYNALFSSWPCLLTFAFERDVDLNIVKKFPILYEAGSRNYFFNLKVFWGYILTAIFHAFISFYIPTLGMINSNNDTGITFNHWYKSTTSFTIVIHIITIKLLVISNFWNVLNISACIFSILFYYICLIILCTKPIATLFQNEIAGLFFNIIAYPKFWSVILISPFVALTLDISLKQFFYNGCPNPTEYIKRNLNDPVFQSIVFNDENQNQKFNSAEAKITEKRLQEILKNAREKKMRRRQSILGLIENKDFVLRHGMSNQLLNKDENEVINLLSSNNINKLQTSINNINPVDSFKTSNIDSSIKETYNLNESNIVNNDSSENKMRPVAEKRSAFAFRNVSKIDYNDNHSFNSEKDSHDLNQKLNQNINEKNKDELSNNKSQVSAYSSSESDSIPGLEKNTIIKKLNKAKTLKTFIDQYKQIKK
jgi:magnesium-transporting ATPase (P-type)